MKNRIKAICGYILKWLVGIIVFGLIINGFLLLYAWLYFGESNSRSRGATRDVFKQLLQIPYTKDYLRKALKEGWQDLEPISYEEWMSMDYECNEMKDNTGWYPWLGATKADLLKLGENGRKHILCLSTNPFYYKVMGPKNAMPKHCTSMFNCHSISIYIHDYILKYPKVLRNIIKIAEKPCYYLKDPPSKEENRELYRNIDQLRGELYCDKNKGPYGDKTYMVIYILDKEGYQSGQLIIPRIDNIYK